MPKLDEIPAVGALAEMVRRAVREGRVELLRDEATDARAALVPWKLLLELVETGGPPMESLRRRVLEIASEEHATQEAAQDLPLAVDGEARADSANDASIALLESWLEEDATDDPQEIREAEEELEQFKQGSNAERERAGARRIYA